MAEKYVLPKKFNAFSATPLYRLKIEYKFYLGEVSLPNFLLVSVKISETAKQTVKK